MPGRRPPADFLVPHVVADDGLGEIRPAQAWSRDKLSIITSYSRAFTRAAQRAPATCFVDGMAGTGLYKFPDGSFIEGSTVIAAATSPPFTRVLAIAYGRNRARALRARVRKYGERVVVHQGDCNADIIDFMSQYVPARAATFVLLDPEGYDLDFSTVEDVARWRPEHRVELLILVDTGSAPRIHAQRDNPRFATRGAGRIDFALPFDWRGIVERGSVEELPPEQVRDNIAERYCDAVRRLGYRHVLARPITRSSPNDPAVYHLIFATDNDAGRKIMEYVFRTMYANAEQVPTVTTPARLPGFD